MEEKDELELDGDGNGVGGWSGKEGEREKAE